MTAFETVTAHLSKLNRNELEDVADHVAALLAELAEAPAGQDPAGQSEHGGAGQGGKGGSWYELRMIGDNGPYLYRRWREGGRKRSEYMGKAQTK